MSFESAGSTWAIVIDTDTYAGNFERELTAFCTGHVGECGNGGEFIDRFHSEEDPDPFPDDDEQEAGDGTPMILSLPDDNGCRRPCSIHTTPGWFNDGVGHHYREGDHPSEDEMIDAHHASQVEYFSRSHPNDRERNLQRNQQDTDRMREAGRVTRFPAYMSVAIFFDAKPTRPQIGVIRRRAETFFAEGLHDPHGLGKASVTIEGFRLIERRVELVEHEVDPWNAEWSERIPQETARTVIAEGQMLGTCCHEKDCYWTVYRHDGQAYIGLCDGTDLWRIAEATVRTYLSKR